MSEPSKLFYLASARLTTRKDIKKVLLEFITNEGEHVGILLSGQNLLEIERSIAELRAMAPEIAEWKSTPRTLS